VKSSKLHAIALTVFGFIPDKNLSDKHFNCFIFEKISTKDKEKSSNKLI